MKNQELKVLFYLKKTTADKNGLSPVMGRITNDNTIAQFSAKLKCSPKLWDERKGRLKGKSAEALRVNRAIERLNLSIHDCYKSLAVAGDTITAEAVKNGFQGIASVQQTVLKLFAEHNGQFSKRVTVDRAEATLKKFEVSFKHLTTFIRKKYRVSDITFARLDLAFIQGYDHYLRVEKRLQPGSIVNILGNLRKVVRIALSRGIISSYPFDGYSFPIPKARPRPISMEEMERIAMLPLSLKNQIISRDMFLFSCWTGISCVDVSELTEDKIVTEDDGTLWISACRHKTGTPYRVRLLPPAIAIIDKYKRQKNGFLFPFPKRNTIIYSISIIGKKCGFDRPLNFHTGRHTFSTLCLSKGMGIETLSRILGHRSIQTTQIYAKITNTKIAEDMKTIAALFEGKTGNHIANEVVKPVKKIRSGKEKNKNRAIS